MNAQTLKEYLLEDIERVEKVLESVECHSIWRSRDEIRCAPKDGNDHTAISINMETLYCRFYGQGETFRGDLISLVQLFRKESFPESFRFIRSLFGLTGKFVKDNRIDPLATFKNLRKQHKVITSLDEIEVPMFGMEALSEFVTLPHMSLFYEGITTQTQELFKTGYDPSQDRVLFPHFHYSNKSAVVGITGRTLRSKEEIKEFKIPKYFNYIKGYKKMYNLYGFSQNSEFITRDGMLIIFEAEKSVLKESSMTRNEGHGASTGGHELSDVQVQIILQNTPSDVEIVIAYDKDVMTMKDEDGKDIGEEFIIRQAKKLSRYRKASYIFDNYNILGEKDSPVDKGVKIWNYLLKYRKEV